MTDPDKSRNNDGRKDLTDKFNFIQKVADLSPSILFVIDLREQKIIYVSQKVKELMGYGADYILSRGSDIFKILLHPEDYERRMENLEKCRSLSGEEECEVEVRFRTGENEWEWYRIKEKVFEQNENGKVTHVIGTAQNIHEQKIGEERLREEHRRLENAQTIGLIGSFERKLPGDIMECSEEFFRILGIEPRAEGLSLDQFYSFVHPDDLEPLLNAVEKTHATGLPFDTLTRIIRPDKTIKHIHRRAGIIKDEHGNPLRVYGTMQDITQRVEAEEERKRAENLMRSTETLAGMGSYELDLHTHAIYFSDGLYRLFGEEPDSFIPSLDWIDQHSHPDDVPVVQKIINAAVEDKTSYTYTRRIYRKDGSLRILEAHGRFITSPQDGNNRIIGLVQDITERKQAEEELRKSEKRTRNLLEVLQNAPDAYLVLSSDLYIQMASDAYLEATDTEREQIIGKYVFDAFPDNPSSLKADGVENLHSSLRKVLETKKAHRMTIQHYDVQSRDGHFVEKHWSPTNTPVVNSEGEVEYIIHRVLDITDVIKERTAVKGLASETEMLKTSLEEIKLQAEMLRESRTLLQSIFDASPNSIILYKSLYGDDGEIEDFEFLMVNAYNYFSLGVSRDIKGKRLLQEFPTAKRIGIFDHFKRTAGTGESADFEVWYPADGLENWFHFRAAKLNDLLVVTAEDITERKNNEETLQQMLQGSITAITILQSIRNAKGEIIDFHFKGANKAAESINNLSSEQLIGKRLLEVFPGVKEAFFASYVEVVETGKPLRVRRPYTKEGFNHWFDVSAVKNGDGFIMNFLDITDQKRAEQELIQLKEEVTQRATDKYRKIINSMDEGFCLLEIIRNETGACVDYRYLEINPVFELQTGMKDVLGKTINELVPNIENFWLEIYGNVARTGESIRFEDYAEGMGRWFDVNAFRIDAPNEQHVAVMFKDITERKEAEERKTFLLNLNDSIRSLEDPAKIQETAMHILGAHLEVNRAYYSEILGDENTLKGRQGYVRDVAPLTERVKISDFSRALQEKFKAGETLVLEDFQEAFKNDEEAKAAINAAQVRACIAVPLIKHGKLVAIVAVHQATPRQWTPQEVALVEEVCEQTWTAMEKAQAEKALRESEQRFRNLVEASALAVWETESDGTVVKDSISWRAFTGQSYEEWIGEGWLNAVHEEDRFFARREWKEAIASQKKIDGEFRLMSASGDARWTSVKAIPILDIEGKVTKWTGMNIDIHDRKQAEDALIKAKEEAEAASRAKEDFLSTMSHEIRTPLNAVIGLTNLLLDKSPRKDQEENLNSLSFSAKNLLALINDILDFSKLEAGKAELTITDFDFPALLMNLKQAHQPLANNRDIKLELQVDEKIPQRICADQLKLSQVLHNLVSNAVKFTSQGEVRISVALDRRENEVFWLDFEIKDTGIGISEEKMEHVFEKFTQAESSTVRQYGGTGLGLSITRLLLELMDSEIKVESTPGKGSRFYFSLPVKQATKEVVPAVLSEQLENVRNLQDLKILLVEDVEINRKIILQFLQNWWQLEPDEAKNGKEAVEMATQNQYDLILMDIRMPVMDGYKATREIKKLPGYKKIPILALTADKNQEVQQADHETKFDGLLTKPFEPLDLKKKILLHLPHTRIPNENIPQNSDLTPSEDPSQDLKIQNKLLVVILDQLKEYRNIFSNSITSSDLKELEDLQHKAKVLFEIRKLDRLSKTLEESVLLLEKAAGKERRTEILQKGKALFEEAIMQVQEEIEEPGFEISRYVAIAGKNQEVLKKLITNSISTLEFYEQEFTHAANKRSPQALSELVHKNTTSLHYLQANRLKTKINEFRDLLQAPDVPEDKLQEKQNEVLVEFNTIIFGLQSL